jgi:hypothetical protein
LLHHACADQRLPEQYARLSPSSSPSSRPRLVGRREAGTAGARLSKPQPARYKTTSGSAGWVSGSIRAKTYGSAVHMMFQILAGSQICQGIWTLRGGTAPRCHDHVRQLSRKGRLDGSEQSSQAVEKTTPLICIFPEDTCSWESLLLFGFSPCGALTIGFRFGAAANPGCWRWSQDLLCPGRSYSA